MNHLLLLLWASELGVWYLFFCFFLFFFFFLMVFVFKV